MPKVWNINLIWRKFFFIIYVRIYHIMDKILLYEMKTCFVSFTFLFRPRKNLSRSYCKRPIPLRCCRPRTIKLLRSWMYSLAAKYLIRYISPYQVPYTYVFSNSIDTWKPGVTGVSLYDSKIRFERVGNRFANCVHPVMFPRRINRGNACQQFIPRRRKLSSRMGERNPARNLERNESCESLIANTLK